MSDSTNLQEIAEILARGYLRQHAGREKSVSGEIEGDDALVDHSGESSPLTENSLDFQRRRSV